MRLWLSRATPTTALFVQRISAISAFAVPFHFSVGFDLVFSPPTATPTSTLSPSLSLFLLNCLALCPCVCLAFFNVPCLWLFICNNPNCHGYQATSQLYFLFQFADLFIATADSSSNNNNCNCHLADFRSVTKVCWNFCASSCHTHIRKCICEQTFCIFSCKCIYSWN